jgi:Sigma-70, region 4
MFLPGNRNFLSGGCLGRCHPPPRRQKAATLRQRERPTGSSRQTSACRLWMSEGGVQGLRMRAGLDKGGRQRMLEETGKEMGITKERVRQLNVHIMKKLRAIGEEQHLDLP